MDETASGALEILAVPEHATEVPDKNNTRNSVLEMMNSASKTMNFVLKCGNVHPGDVYALVLLRHDRELPILLHQQQRQQHQS